MQSASRGSSGGASYVWRLAASGPEPLRYATVVLARLPAVLLLRERAVLASGGRPTILIACVVPPLFHVQAVARALGCSSLALFRFRGPLSFAALALFTTLACLA